MANLTISIQGNSTMGEARKALQTLLDHTLSLSPERTVEDAFGLAVIHLYANTLNIGDAKVTRR